MVLNLKDRTDRRDRMTLAAAATNFTFDLQEAVRGIEVIDKAFPEGGLKSKPPGHIGAWRSHIDSFQRMVRENVQSALILEDDIDWDIRIRPLLQNFAKAVNVIQKHDPAHQGDYTFADLPQTPAPVLSPYGDDWDVLWLGHCRMLLPNDRPERRVVIHNDETVPEPQHLLPEPVDDFQTYPNHTRIVFPVASGICIGSMAVSQKGARALLHDFSLFKVEHTIDDALRKWCFGSHGYKQHKCYTVRPALFDIAWADPGAAADTDTDAVAVQSKQTAASKGVKHQVRHSVVRNLYGLLQGNWNVVDGYPDHDAR